MAEIKHTPGPWTVHHRMRDCVTFEGRDGTENLFLENIDGYYACQNEADAHLIAAAPDLLEALREVIDTPHLGGKGGFQKARAAIAKATGDDSLLRSIRAREAS
ncbi:conserved protein of unknown function [Burkholderia multivorans]